MFQNELDQLLAQQNESSEQVESPSSSTSPEPTENAVESPPEQTKPNYNPYSYPPPSLGMPLGGIPPHLLPHMAQIMQNGLTSTRCVC